MKFWLDDKREPPSNWLWVYTVSELIYNYRKELTKPDGYVTDISLDYDLGEGLQTGYDFLLWLEDQIRIREIKNLPRLHVHSQDVVGSFRMEDAINKIKHLWNNT